MVNEPTTSASESRQWKQGTGYPVSLDHKPPTSGSDELEGSLLSDNRFNRFDDELIDKYFNEDGKAAIRKYVAAKVAEAEIAAQLSEPNADWYKEQYRQAIIKFNKATELMESATEILRDSGAHLQRKQGGSKR